MAKKQITDADRIQLLLNELYKLEDQVIKMTRTFDHLGVVAEGRSIETEDNKVESARHNGRAVAYTTCALTLESLVGECRKLRNEAYRTY